MGALWFFLSERKNNKLLKPVSSEQRLLLHLSINAAAAQGFRLCGGGQRAFRSPFGNLRPPLVGGNEQATKAACFINTDGSHLPLCIIAAAAQGFRLCGGGQRAFRSPFGNLRPPPVEEKGRPCPLSRLRRQLSQRESQGESGGALSPFRISHSEFRIWLQPSQFIIHHF